MHPSGNAWMFHFTHRYSMTRATSALDILTSSPEAFIERNPERYKGLQVRAGAGAARSSRRWARSSNRSRARSPMLPIRRMVLAGTSASAGVLVNYLPAHMVLRLADMKPIFDGFLPTSNGATIRRIDVPMIQVPTMTEVAGGAATARRTATNRGISSASTSSPAWRTSIRATPPLTTRPVPAADQPLSRWPPTCRWRSITCGSGSTRAPFRRAPSGSWSIATRPTTDR